MLLTAFACLHAGRKPAQKGVYESSMRSLEGEVCTRTIVCLRVYRHEAVSELRFSQCACLIHRCGCKRRLKRPLSSCPPHALHARRNMLKTDFYDQADWPKELRLAPTSPLVSCISSLMSTHVARFGRSLIYVDY